MAKNSTYPPTSCDESISTSLEVDPEFQVSLFNHEFKEVKGTEALKSEEKMGDSKGQRASDEPTGLEKRSDRVTGIAESGDLAPHVVDDVAFHALYIANIL